MFENLGFFIAKRWIAGPSISDAVRVTKRVNSNGVRAILNYLGEELTDAGEIRRNVEMYFQLMDEIRSSNLDADVSLKPTQIGLSVSYDLARENYAQILRYAKVNDVFVWLDMEASRYVEPTIRLYLGGLTIAREGIAIQSYLKRSNEDVKEIVKRGGVIRLVKGAYKEPPDIAYVKWKDKTENYRVIMKYLFENANEFTVATHDTRIVREAVEMNRAYGRDVTVAMLLGIKNKFLYGLQGQPVRRALYIPYGEKWLDYARRRLKEASNLILVLRSLFEL